MTARILMIEDNVQNSYLGCYLLGHRGHDVTVASDGPTGLELAVALQPDLILLDIQLPGMDGHEVARRLKAAPALRAVPVVAVTSYALPGDREKCLEAGAEGYIEKPIDPDTFVDQIEQFLPPALRSAIAGESA